MKSRETILITFGAGGAGWESAARRIKRDAKSIGIFDEVISLDESWIKVSSPDVWGIINKYLSRDLKRGFGYWMWKPAILKWADLNWPDKQILYVDSGFHIEKNEFLIHEFVKFLKLSDESGGIAFSQKGLKEVCWTKEEIFQYFKINNNGKELDQLYAGLICLPPSSHRTNLVNEFYDLIFYKDGFLFNDILISEQSPKFIENRHDQSLYSILWRSNGLRTMEDLSDKSNLGNFLFIAMRNRTGLSATLPSPILRGARGINKVRDWKSLG